MSTAPAPPHSGAGLGIDDLDAVEAGGAQPGLRPLGDGLVGCGCGQGVDEVVQASVGEHVAMQIGVDSSEELLIPEPRRQLSQQRVTLGVGDGVEVARRRSGVRDVVRSRGDGMG